MREEKQFSFDSFFFQLIQIESIHHRSFFRHFFCFNQSMIITCRTEIPRLFKPNRYDFPKSMIKVNQVNALQVRVLRREKKRCSIYFPLSCRQREKYLPNMMMTDQGQIFRFSLIIIDNMSDIVEKMTIS